MSEHPLFASPYLARLADRAVPGILDLDDDAIRSRLESCVSGLENTDTGGKDADEYLREKKQEFALLWAKADIDNLLEFQQLGRLQTSFAEATIRFALYHAWRIPRVLRAIEDPDIHPSGKVPGLFVLGLGKLGGYDLNFSSDIDLIAFYDPDIIAVRPGQGKTDVCTRVLQEMTRILSEQQVKDFVWRVDWRLRPEASSSALAMSVSAAEEFYFYRSLPWHRLALIKARVIAGDQAIGQRFMNDIKPYIWPRNLDYRMADELRHLKNRINLEHPGLKVQRQQNQQILAEAAGCNLKLGRGGIREIEFIANAQQLVWGGRKPALQTSNTLDVIQLLAEDGILDSVVADELSDAYRFLRTLENRLQMLQNAQTQILPMDTDSQDRLLRLVNIGSWAELEQKLLHTRMLVATRFDTMFSTEDKEREDDEELPAWCAELENTTAAIIAEWDEGFQVYGVPNTLAMSMEPLFRRLLQLISENAITPDAGIMSIHDFFKSLPPGGQYFRMLSQFPHLLDSIVPPLIASPPMTSLLSQSPHIADVLAEPGTASNRDVFLTNLDIVLLDTDYEHRMEGLRRFINEQLYSVYLEFVNGEISGERLSELLTVLAEIALEGGVKTVCDHMNIDSSPISILGLGKLGMHAMAPLSDLDLIYLTGEQRGIDLANRFSSRLQTLMATPMREGRVYEMDMRLRPSGRSGSPTLSLESFSKHHMDRARTWEHQALVAARYITGDERTGEMAMAIREDVLTRPRSKQQLVNDTHKMLQRIREQKIVKEDRDTLKVKLRPGGMLETDYLSNSLVLMHAAQFPALVQGSYSEGLLQISAISGHTDLYEIIEFWRVLQYWVRLLGLEDQSVHEIPGRYRDNLFASLDVENADQLLERVKDNSSTVLNYLDEFFRSSELTDSKAMEAWEESPVIWEPGGPNE